MYRCFSRPCLDMRGVGSPAGSVDIVGGASIGEDGESDAEVDPLPEWSRRSCFTLQPMRRDRRSAAHRGRRVPSNAGVPDGLRATGLDGRGWSELDGFQRGAVRRRRARARGSRRRWANGRGF